MIGASNTVILSAVSVSVILSFICSFIYRLLFTFVAVIRGIILGVKDAVRLCSTMRLGEYLRARVLGVRTPGRVLSEIINFIYILLCGAIIIVANYVLLDGALRLVFPFVFVFCFVIFSVILKKPVIWTVEHISRILVWITLVIVYIISKTVVALILRVKERLKKEIMYK